MPVEWSVIEDWLEAQDDHQIEVNEDGTFQLGEFTAVEPQTLYDYGENEDLWIEGHNVGSGQYSKNFDNLELLVAENDSEAEYTWSTSQSFDVTDYDQIEVTWQNTGDDSFDVSSSVLLLDDPGDEFPASTPVTDSGNFDVTTATGDISGQTGNYYIGIRTADNDSKSSLESNLYTYYVELNNP